MCSSIKVNPPTAAVFFFVDHGWKKPVFPEHAERVDRGNHAGTDQSGTCQVWNSRHHSCSSKGHFWWIGKYEFIS